MRKSEEDNSTPEFSAEEARATLINLLEDFLTGPMDEMTDYFSHVKFDMRGIKTPSDLRAAWCALYRTGRGTYDVERAFTELATWPPVAERIAYLRVHPEELNSGV